MALVTSPVETSVNVSSALHLRIHVLSKDSGSTTFNITVNWGAPGPNTSVVLTSEQRAQAMTDQGLVLLSQPYTLTQAKPVIVAFVCLYDSAGVLIQNNTIHIQVSQRDMCCDSVTTAVTIMTGTASHS